MEIMMTAHEGNDAVILQKVQVAEMNEMEFYNYARVLLPLKWQWDDYMQLVYHITESSYLLISYTE